MNCFKQDSPRKIRSGETDYSNSRVFCRHVSYFLRLNLNWSDVNLLATFPFTTLLIVNLLNKSGSEMTRGFTFCMNCMSSCLKGQLCKVIVHATSLSSSDICINKL